MKTDAPLLPTTRREAIRQPRRNRPSKITIPENVSPHVKLVFLEMQRQRRTYDEIEEGSGVLRATLKAWRHRNKPGIDSIEAVLGFLGWDLTPIPRARVLPKELVADLESIAARHELDVSATIEALVALVARVHERFPTPEIEAPPTAPEIDDMAIGGTDAQAT